MSYLSRLVSIAILLITTCSVLPSAVAASSESTLLVETDKDSYALGDVVTVTVTNTGNKTVYWQSPQPWQTVRAL